MNKKIAYLVFFVIFYVIPLPVFALVTAISFDCGGKATDDLVVGDIVSSTVTFDVTGNIAHAYVRNGPNQLYSGVGTTNFVAGVPITVTQTLTVTPAAGTLRFAIQNFGDNVLVVCPDEVDLIITKMASDPTPNVGDAVTYSIEVENMGPGAATNIVVTDIVPAGVTYVAGSMTGIAPVVPGITPDESSPSGTGLEWTINNLANGATTTLTFQAVVQPP